MHASIVSISRVWPFLFAAGMVTLGIPAHNGELVDQRNDPRDIPPTFQSIRSYGPIGQEFTPTAHMLNRVELYVADFDVGGSGATLVAVVRRGTIDGPILAESKPLKLADEFEGVAVFVFAKPVRLDTGTLRVFEVKVAQGDDWSVCVGDDRYDRGRQVAKGEPRADSDLWFKTALVTAAGTE